MRGSPAEMAMTANEALGAVNKRQHVICRPDGLGRERDQSLATTGIAV